MKRKLVLIIASIILSGSNIFAQSYHFTFNPYAYSCNLNTWVAVELDGVRLSSSDIELAAFVGDECRGTTFLADFGIGDSYLACIQIKKDNSTVGETFSFKMYDHATETEYDDCSTTYTSPVAGDEMYASPTEPIVAVFTSPATPSPSGPEHPWIPVGTASNMSIFAEIQINGVPISGDNWEVGAFCGDECRGDHVGFETAPTSFGYMMTIIVYGVTGDVLNFYLYDIENESIVGECSTTVTYVEQGSAGVVWDPIILNFVTTPFTLDILAYTPNSKDRYYLIASPIGEVSPGNVTNMLKPEYDLFYFDQSKDLEWVNYKEDDNSTNPGFNLVPGKGYLYANSQDVTLKFYGEAYSGNGEVELSYDESANLAGWNLIGNPFSVAATPLRTDAETGDSNPCPFYVMNEDGSEITPSEGTVVDPMHGIFVIADYNGEILTFSTVEAGKNQGLIVNVTHNRGAAIDRAIVRFDNKGSLPKFMLNERNTKLYIPQNGKDYAIVTSEGHGELPLNFKADKNGTYTLNFSTEGLNLCYLHLIDNMTGNNVDLLADPNYSFQAKTTDYASRFKIVFATESAAEDHFAFFSNGNWIINNDGQATLQVIDVLGHILSSETINGNAEKKIKAAPGVYLLCLINSNNVRVQKIIIK